MLVLVWPQSWVPGVLRSEGAHNCALTTTHTASQAGPAPAGQQELSRVTQSQHSGGWRAHSLAVSRCPAETTPTLACSRYSALPGDTVRALRVTQTRPRPGNTRPPPLPPCLSSSSSSLQTAPLQVRPLQTILRPLQLQARLQDRLAGGEQETLLPRPSQHGGPEEKTLRGGGQQETLGRSHPH